MTLLGVIIASLLTLYGSHIVSKRATKSADKATNASVQEAINSGFAALTAGFNSQIAEAHSRFESALAEITELRGEIRELVQHIESLEGLLRRNGVPVPERTRPQRLTLLSPPAAS